jgi:hypothetical protein
LYGLPAGVDFRFFMGLMLTQVCIGLHELILHFGSDATVTVEGDLGVRAPAHPEQIVSDYRQAAADVASLLGRTVADVEPQDDGTLSLDFAGGWRLNFYDSSAHYESYQIQHGTDYYVV